MSVKVMSMVFERYPVGGGELLLALAMADHARDDGTHIFPSIDALASKTRQSRSTVQRLTKRMVGRGWLQPVRMATGRPGLTNHYRIDPQWICATGSTGVNLTSVPSRSDDHRSV